MNNFPQLRILHISDLHFHSPTNGQSNHICHPGPTGATAGIPTLVDLIRRDLSSEYWNQFEWACLPEKAPPLLIAATGDLTHTASPADFHQAHSLLTGLTQSPILGTQVKINDIFVIPGNHDVVFTKSDPAERFAPYCIFYNKLFQGIRNPVQPHEASGLSQVHLFPEHRFLIAEINSCYYVEKETIDESRGHVDVATLKSLQKALDQVPSEAKGWIKIALVHHHPVLLPSFIESEHGVDAIMNAWWLLELLRERGFQLILHGHKHFPQIFSYDPDPAWTTAIAPASQLIVAGGSAGSMSLPPGKQRSNTYNLLTVKWIPNALQARIQVITRGLVREGDAGALPPYQWKWQTLRVYDKVLFPGANVGHLPMVGRFRREPFPKPKDELEKARDEQYEALRFNMPVVDVVPSLTPGQGFEARVWLERHRYHEESPTEVIWSAGKRFDRKICDQSAAPEFCVYFQYYGPALIQAQLKFEDGKSATSYVYARLPGGGGTSTD
jgi:predicted MPP superfamily phosphohydrolase